MQPAERAERQERWKRLGALVDRMQRRGPRSLSSDEITELIYLYRQAAADLAGLRASGESPEQVRSVNRLVTRVHAQLYRRPARQRPALGSFFLAGFPQIVRRRWRYMAASLLLTVAFGWMGYFSVQDSPSVVADILGGAETEFRGPKTGEGFISRFRDVQSPVLSSLVTTNNIRVALGAFALGVTFGIGTVYLLIVNGSMVGGFAGAYAQSGAAGAFWMTILVHGALELTAIVIAGGAGLILGHALWCPGRRTRLRALREEARDAVLIALGLIPAFMIAGFLEGFITPAEGIPPMVKTVLGVSVMLVYWLYLAVAGRKADAAEARPVIARPNTD